MKKKFAFLAAALSTLVLAGSFYISPVTNAVQDRGKECRRCCDWQAKACEQEQGPGNQAVCRAQKDECLRGCSADTAPQGDNFPCSQ